MPHLIALSETPWRELDGSRNPTTLIMADVDELPDLLNELGPLTVITDPAHLFLNPIDYDVAEMPADVKAWYVAFEAYAAGALTALRAARDVSDDFGATEMMQAVFGPPNGVFAELWQDYLDAKADNE